MRKEFRGTLAY